MLRVFAQVHSSVAMPRSRDVPKLSPAKDESDSDPMSPTNSAFPSCTTPQTEGDKKLVGIVGNLK